jgi:hypothetical protein
LTEGFDDLIHLEYLFPYGTLSQHNR